jgi:hypothetical protein
VATTIGVGSSPIAFGIFIVPPKPIFHLIDSPPPSNQAPASLKSQPTPSDRTLRRKPHRSSAVPAQQRRLSLTVSAPPPCSFQELAPQPRCRV